MTAEIQSLKFPRKALDMNTGWFAVQRSHSTVAIHCLAFEDTRKKNRLAVSRADSSIEIWSIKDDWHQEVIIPGCDGTSVESLVWCRKRLFSSGLHGEITEWDLNKLSPKRTADSFGGAVWCLAVNHARTYLVAGCEDGCVRLYDITDDGLQYYRALDKQEGRVLSLCWHKDDKVLVTGSSDSTVRLYNIESGHCTLRITMDKVLDRSTLVWAVQVTSNFTIITGDSIGNTQFWDGKQGTLLQSHKAHSADVLALCINEDENLVFTGGVDSKLVQFQLTSSQGQGPSWVRSKAVRMHSHDIRALALYSSRDMLLSGGVDTHFVVYSVKEYGRSHPQRIRPFPHRPLVSLAQKAKILMYQKDTTLQFWRLGDSDAKSTVLQKTPVQLLQLNAKGNNHIMCSAVSSCSKWASFSDIHHVSLFHMNFEQDDPKPIVSRVLPLPVDLLPAHRMVFTSDGARLVCASAQNSLQVLELSEAPVVCHTIEIPREAEELAVSLTVVSSDCQWVACADTAHVINVFSLENLKHHCTLPRFDSQVTAMAFQPETNALLLVCSSNQIYIYNTKKVKMTSWTKRALEQGLPTQWLRQYCKVVDISFSPACHEVVLLQNHNMFTVLDLREPLPNPDVTLFEHRIFQAATRKRKQVKAGEEKSREEQKAFKVCRKYQPLLFAGFNEDGSLVVVERPWVSVMEALPPTLQRKKYGT